MGEVVVVVPLLLMVSADTGWLHLLINKRARRTKIRLEGIETVSCDDIVVKE